jgi:hypothetical protein
MRILRNEARYGAWHAAKELFTAENAANAEP